MSEDDGLGCQYCSSNQCNGHCKEYTITHLEQQLTAANALILECGPYLKERETPLLCIKRNRKDAVQALEMCADEMIKKEGAERQLTAANARVEELEEAIRNFVDSDVDNMNAHDSAYEALAALPEQEKE